ncbi:PTS system alpha-glucoside-specific EIICB component, partial [Dissostichus eleginoides]
EDEKEEERLSAPQAWENKSLQNKQTHTSEIKHAQEYKNHTGHKADESYTQNIRALFLLSSMNDGSPGPPSDERARRCLQ